MARYGRFFAKLEAGPATPDFSRMSIASPTLSTSSEASTIFTPRTRQSSLAIRVDEDNQEHKVSHRCQHCDATANRLQVDWSALPLNGMLTPSANHFLFTTYYEHKTAVRKVDPDGEPYYVYGHGTVKLQLLTRSGLVVEHVLREVEYAPLSNFNVVSTQELKKDSGIEYTCEEGDLTLVNSTGVSQGYGLSRGMGFGQGWCPP